MAALGLGLLLFFSTTGRPAWTQSDDPAPPAAPVKLIFVHHSTGGNWLADPNGDQPYGGLGIALRDNNYFVSATNYGWGPESIGDRTDIPNWPEWFTGPQSETYLNALYHESGQNIGDFGAWSRLGADPGGENEIIMFKSCFPNSDLDGSPGDPPLPEANDWEYSVANAKAVYNNLLTYFQTRPDKLFIVITAPPLMQSETAPERAANARAFNNWLVNEWLQGYPAHNVAVFDYYNVLTAADNHHRWNNGQIEHVQPVDTNFSAYPSGDSHPNTAGHSKATAEFVPLLNVYYHRWKNAPAQAPAPTSTPAQEAQPTSTPAEEKPPTPTPAEGSTTKPAGVIEDWEGENWWDSYGDGDKSTVVAEVDTVTFHGGAASLRVEYNISAEGWGDTGTSFEQPQDWSGGNGLSLWVHADAPALLILVLFAGDPETPTAFETELALSEAQVDGWSEVLLPWEAFTLAPWNDNPGLKTLDPAHITGIDFNFTPGKGTFWVDDITLFSGEIQPPAEPTPTSAPKAAPTATPQTQAPPTSTSKPAQPAPTSTPAAQPAKPTSTPQAKEPPEAEARGGLCASMVVFLGVVLAAWLFRR